MDPRRTDISKLTQRNDPLPDFKWVISPSSAIIPNGGLPDINGVSLPLTYVESIDLPFRNINIVGGVYAGGTYSYYAGSHDISSITINFYEDVKASALKYITQWKNLIKNFSTGIYSLPSVYKKDLMVQLLDFKNSPVITARLIGIWPADTSALNLNYTTNGNVVYSQVFSVDDQEIKFNK